MNSNRPWVMFLMMSALACARASEGGPGKGTHLGALMQLIRRAGLPRSADRSRLLTRHHPSWMITDSARRLLVMIVGKLEAHQA
jgi:hypothetical protein